MFKNFTITDKLLFVASFLSLIFSEILYFQGQKAEGTFIGLWVPSILAFGIYLKLINNTKNGWFDTLFCGVNNFNFWSWFLFCHTRSKKNKLNKPRRLLEPIKTTLWLAFIGVWKNIPLPLLIRKKIGC